MFCLKCGNEIPDKAIFCPKCGQHIKHDSKEGTASAAPSFTEKTGVDSEHGSLFRGNPLYPKIALGVAVAVVLLIVLLVSGLGRNGNADTSESSESNEPISTGSKADDAPEAKEDPVKAKLAEADSAFGRGDYDTALRLYREIDTDYAQNRVRAIECIPIADAIAKEWLEKTDDPVANGIVLAAFNLDFTFDTEYDPQTYTFYTKMYYPSFYTDLATAFGTSRETIKEGVTSSGHEKAAYKMFCDRGYEDITCVSNMYDGDGELMASFPYNKEIQEEEIIREQHEAEAAEAQMAADREANRQEFIKGINSSEEFQEIVDTTLKRWDTKNAITTAIEQYWRNHKDEWQYELLSAFEVTEAEYGDRYVLDSERESEGLKYVGSNYSIDQHIAVVHLPCKAVVSALKGFGPGQEVIFDVEMEIVMIVNTELIRSTYLSNQESVAILSMEVDETLTSTPEENPLDIPCPWAGMSAYSSTDRSWGTVGETFVTDWFSFAVESVYTAQKYSDLKASAGNQLVVANVSVENIYSYPIAFDDTDLRIYWNKGEDSRNALQSVAGNILDVGETYADTLIYEVPEQIQNFAIILADGEPLYPKVSIVGFSFR